MCAMSYLHFFLSLTGCSNRSLVLILLAKSEIVTCAFCGSARVMLTALNALTCYVIDITGHYGTAVPLYNKMNKYCYVFLL